MHWTLHHKTPFSSSKRKYFPVRPPSPSFSVRYGNIWLSQAYLPRKKGIFYAIPSEISLQSATTPAEGLDPTFGPYLRWDLYEQLGCPEIGSLEDLLPVLKQMQELYPETESGQKTYGFSFFSDWDGNLMNAAKQPCCFYGYDEFGFLLAKADGSDYQDIADSDSLYMRVLKLYFDANQLGLVDPESRKIED